MQVTGGPWQGLTTCQGGIMVIYLHSRSNGHFLSLTIKKFGERSPSTNDLLHIMESKNGQNEMLEKEVNKGIITEAEKNELLNNLDTETIKRILSHRVFNISKM